MGKDLKMENLKQALLSFQVLCPLCELLIEISVHIVGHLIKQLQHCQHNLSSDPFPDSRPHQLLYHNHWEGP